MSAEFEKMPLSFVEVYVIYVKLLQIFSESRIGTLYELYMKAGLFSLKPVRSLKPH